MLQDYDASDLDEFSRTILKGCDVNKNGRVSQKVFILWKVQTNMQVLFLGTYRDINGSQWLNLFIYKA